jgi:hypothetical protein
MDSAQKDVGSALQVLCFIAGVYGVGVGILSLPTALFVGPHLLAASMAHLGLGIAFLWAGSGVARRSMRALAVATACGTSVAIVGMVAVWQLMADQDRTLLVAWSCLTLYFICLSVIAVRQWFTWKFTIRDLVMLTTVVSVITCALAALLRLGS